MKDWRGNEYYIGSTVIYPRASGRSVEITEAVVEDIYMVYYHKDKCKWVRVPEGEAPPEALVGTNYSGLPEIKTRVKLKPTGPGSRAFYRGGVGIFKDEPIKSVTLLDIENITVVPERGDYQHED